MCMNSFIGMNCIGLDVNFIKGFYLVALNLNMFYLGKCVRWFVYSYAWFSLCRKVYTYVAWEGGELSGRCLNGCWKPGRNSVYVNTNVLCVRELLRIAGAGNSITLLSRGCNSSQCVQSFPSCWRSSMLNWKTNWKLQIHLLSFEKAGESVLDELVDWLVADAWRDTRGLPPPPWSSLLPSIHRCLPGALLAGRVCSWLFQVYVHPGSCTQDCCVFSIPAFFPLFTDQELCQMSLWFRMSES